MEAGPQLAVPCPAPSTPACPPGVGRPPQRGTQGGNTPRVGSADGASDGPAAPPSGPLSSVGEWRVPLGAGMVVRAPLPRSPPVLSTPRLSKGGASTRSQHQSAQGSRPPGCLGPPLQQAVPPKPQGEGGPPHSQRCLATHTCPPAGMQPRALSCGPAWTPPRGRDHHPCLRVPGQCSSGRRGARRVGQGEGAVPGGALLLDAQQRPAPAPYQNPGPRRVH